MKRHFTSTTFVLHPKENKILLHWHNKVNAWLPPGGHVEDNETPVDTARRETLEETGSVSYTHLTLPTKTIV